MMNKTLPGWLKQTLSRPSEVNGMNALLADLRLNTVCQNASCPNLSQCFSLRTATFLILGDHCTRRCRFCAIGKGRPLAVDDREPRHISDAIEKLGLDYVVITSVTRDDLPDGGAGHFSDTIHVIRADHPGVKIEVLIPDFQGSLEALLIVLRAYPDVLGHNLETVPGLYSDIRPGADYNRSLEILRKAKEIQPGVLTKSGIMLGLGETAEEVVSVMRDLAGSGCDILTIGQYLRPSLDHAEIERYVTPDEFDDYARIGEGMGLKAVVAGPWVRSSYRAAEIYRQAILRRDMS
jgi:lipoic acid synthetase